MKLHKFLKVLRLHNHKTQADIAKILKVSRQVYLAMEADKRELTLTEAGTLAQLYKIAIDDLLNCKRTPLPKPSDYIRKTMQSLADMGDENPMCGAIIDYLDNTWNKQQA